MRDAIAQEATETYERFVARRDEIDLGNATWSSLAAAGVDGDAALSSHDSHTALDAVDALIRTGATGTNVCDVMACVSVGDASSPGIGRAGAGEAC